MILICFLICIYSIIYFFIKFLNIKFSQPDLYNVFSIILFGNQQNIDLVEYNKLIEENNTLKGTYTELAESFEIDKKTLVSQSTVLEIYNNANKILQDEIISLQKKIDLISNVSSSENFIEIYQTLFIEHYSIFKFIDYAQINL